MYLRAKIWLNALAILVTVLIANTAALASDYSAAGIDDGAAFDKFYTKLRTAVLKDDRKTVADLFCYPMSINGLKAHRIANKAALIAHYDAIFSHSIKDAFKRTEIKDLFCRDQGIMIGDGEMWFNACDDSKDKTHFQIITINPVDKNRNPEHR